MILPAARTDDASTLLCHTPALTAELVLRQYTGLLRSRIRGDSLREDADDIIQDVMLTLTKPGRRGGPNLLESYNPSRGSVVNYLVIITDSVIAKRVTKQSRRDRLAGGPMVELDEPIGEDEHGCLLPAQSVADARAEQALAKGAELQVLLVGLRARFSKASSVSNSGQPRSVSAILAMLLDDFDVKDIAEKLECSRNEVRRKLRALRTDPYIQEMAKGSGFRTS